VEFPLHNVQSRGCTGAASATSAQAACECKDQSGTFTCEKQISSGPSCCYDYGSEMLGLEMPIQATVCGALCLSNDPDYESFCRSF